MVHFYQTEEGDYVIRLDDVVYAFAGSLSALNTKLKELGDHPMSNSITNVFRERHRSLLWRLSQRRNLTFCPPDQYLYGSFVA